MSEAHKEGLGDDPSGTRLVPKQVVRVEVYRCRTCPRTTVFELYEGEHIENARCVRHPDQPSKLVGSWPVALGVPANPANEEHQ